MIFVTCPSCGERGGLPNQLVGRKVRCQKCGKSFLAAAPTAESLTSGTALNLVAVAGKATGDSIDVEGLDASSWASTVVVPEKPIQATEHHVGPKVDHVGFSKVAEKPVQPAEYRELAPAVFTPAHSEAEHTDGPVKQYKLLTQKDKWFDGKFDLGKLEEALNHYARQGWVVRAMSTPHVMGFTGVTKEEIVVLLER
jgi:hypothetical protein